MHESVCKCEFATGRGAVVNAMANLMAIKVAFGHLTDLTAFADELIRFLYNLVTRRGSRLSDSFGYENQTRHFNSNFILRQ